jgi:formylglycine-generating enzyme required for sulfatase activity
MHKKGFDEIEDILEQNANRTNHLLAIAINDYVHCPKLNNAVKDIQDFIGLMTEKFEFKKENIHTLFNAEATKSNIFSRLHHLASTLKPTDNLVIYFSGHGEYDTVLDSGYWIPMEAHKGDFSHYISNTEIKDYLNSIKTHHTFLIADSCFSGTLFTKGGRDVSLRLEKNPSRWGLTSGRNEIVTDGKPGKNSPFAASLLYHLQKTTKPIAVQELCFVVLETTAANANQTPLGEPLQVEGHKSGQFVFRLKKDEKRDWAKAQNMNTKIAYEQFVVLYPNGEFAKTATDKIQAINDDTAWNYASRLNIIKAYAHYEQRFPNGKHLKEAAEKIKILEEDKVWQQTLSYSSYSEYKKYLILYPNGRYAFFAKQAIDAILNIDDIWEKVVAENSIEGFEQFIEQYPDSQFTIEAERLAKEQRQREKTEAIKRNLAAKEAEFAKEKAEAIAAANALTEKEKADAALKTENKIAALKKAQSEEQQALERQIEAVEKGKRNTKSKEIASPIYQKSTSISRAFWQQIPKRYKNIGIAALALIICIWGIAQIPNISGENAEITQEELQSPPDVNPPIEDLMIKVEGGTFQMGSNDAQEDEKPIHEVSVPTFYISKYEVTQKQWQDIMDNNPSYFKGCDNCPVENVSWEDVQEFIKKLNTQTGKKYRLPSEAEWEFAARGGNKSNNYKYSGSNDIEEVAWYGYKKSDKKTHAVGTKKPNELGIYDMSGNVWERCSDWYGVDYYKNSPSNNPKGASSGNSRVLRGGSWLNLDINCRVADRVSSNPTVRTYNSGFRVVRGD